MPLVSGVPIEATSGVDAGQVRAAVARCAGLSAPQDVSVRETHISWVFLTPDRAFKLKKPVVLPFLDYQTPERRRAMCEEEVRLNRRLAPNVYLGMCSVVVGSEGPELVAGAQSDAVDFLVVMRRYRQDDTLAARVQRGAVSSRELARLAQSLARFHADAHPIELADGAVAAHDEVKTNVGELQALLAGSVPRTALDEIARLLEAFMDRNEAMLDGRGARGLVRDGHGDLRGEHVLPGPPVQIVDCVEFDPRLRTVDIADDLAFLVMDLVRLDAEPLARALIAEYRRAGGDCGTDELVWFYATHRALVRTKVALLRAQQEPGAEAMPPEAAALLACAQRCAWRAPGRFALVICGLAASGKSALARELGERFGVTVFSSDVVRKQLAGVPVDVPAPTSLYSAAAGVLTYAELGRRAARELADGSSVIIDATCRRRADRAALLEHLPRGGTWFVECQAPLEVRVERAAARQRQSGHVSDAGPRVVADQGEGFDPPQEPDPGHRLILDTNRSAKVALADLLAWLDSRALGGS